MKQEEIKKVVREGYAKIAKRDSSCCAPVSSCCGSVDQAKDISRNIGYSEEELSLYPKGRISDLDVGIPLLLPH